MANWWDVGLNTPGLPADFYNRTPAERTAIMEALGKQYFDPMGAQTSGFTDMFSKGYTLAQDPEQFGNYKAGNFQIDPNKRVYDPATQQWFYPSEAIDPGAWKAIYPDSMSAWDAGLAAEGIFGAGMGLANYTGLLGGGGSAASAAPVGADAGLGTAGGVVSGGGAAVSDPLGAYLIESGALSPTSAYGASVLAGTPNWAIPGVSGAGGALGYIGGAAPAVNDALGAWLIEHGYEMDPTYAGQVLAGTPNWSVPGISGAGGKLGYEGTDVPSSPLQDLLDKAKKVPSIPPGLLNGGGSPGDGGSGDNTDGAGSIWSDYVNPFSFAAPSIGVPNYQANEPSPYNYQTELARRLALIRGGR